MFRATGKHNGFQSVARQIRYLADQRNFSAEQRIWMAVTTELQRKFVAPANNTFPSLFFLKPQINAAHVLNIIAYPDSGDLPHWRCELITRGNDLTAM
jgi:hypothetical protein